MIYLICGDSNRLIEEKIADIISDGVNIVRIDANNVSIEDILAEASYFSMFNENKYLIVKNANFFGTEKINEADNNRLLDYLNNPNSLTTLIFTLNNKVDMRKKIAKKIKDSYNYIEIPTLKPREIVNKLKIIFNDSKFDIDEKSLNYIVSNNLNNYDLAVNEVEKIITYYNEPCKVLYEDVENIVVKSIETNNFKFLDAVIAKDLSESFRIYNDLKIQKVEPLSLIGLLAREYRFMYLAKELKKDYSFLEICKLLKLQDWQLDKFYKNAGLFSIKELKSNIVLLANLDLNIKSGTVDKYIGFEKLLIDLII